MRDRRSACVSGGSPPANPCVPGRSPSAAASAITHPPPNPLSPGPHSRRPTRGRPWARRVVSGAGRRRPAPARLEASLPRGFCPPGTPRRRGTVPITPLSHSALRLTSRKAAITGSAPLSVREKPLSCRTGYREPPPRGAATSRAVCAQAAGLAPVRHRHSGAKAVGPRLHAPRRSTTTVPVEAECSAEHKDSTEPNGSSGCPRVSRLQRRIRRRPGVAQRMGSSPGTGSR